LNFHDEGIAALWATMPGQGLLSTPESSSAPRGALAVFAPFASDSSELGRILWAQKNPKLLLGAFWGWRSEADGFSAFAVLTNPTFRCG
jgi:hypothetical protein